MFVVAQDADSLDASGKKSEGAFYVWSADEIDEVLGTDSERGRVFKQHYYVKASGNTDLSPRRQALSLILPTTLQAAVVACTCFEVGRVASRGGPFY